jgi:signal transduction histidine kinase
VSAGELKAEVPVGSSAEMDFLAGSLNAMIESFSTSQNRLEEWAGDLEETVATKADELRKAQMEVAQAEKLSSVGMVAAGIAHELNSPLMAIITFAHLVKDKVEPESREHEDLQMIIGEANRCAGIIRQLLDFSREQADPLDKETCEIPDVVAAAQKILKVEMRNRGVELDIDLGPTVPTVEANRAQLMQVLVNLIMNSLHAMPEGGVITVGVDVVKRSNYSGASLPPHPGDGLVRIRIRDSGHGISAAALPRVFDPFFTTKEVGQGSGLGLSVSLGLIQRFHGTILADSDGESWTEFTILIPVPVAPLVGAIR